MLSAHLQWVVNAFPNLSNLDEMAVGGQKLVLSANLPTGDPVVLKLIHPAQDRELTAREIQAVNQIASPRVPAVVDVGTIVSPMGQMVWVIEQRVFGETLRERITRQTLSPIEVLDLGTHLFEVLKAAEAARIVHRDIKPENIMLDTLGNFWLLDFGISRHLAMHAVTPQTQPFGRFTLGYAPPEQVRNIQTEIDSRADLFALGVTLLESHIGTNPFRHGAANDFEILRRVDTQALPALVMPVNEQKALSDLVNSMTQKRRDHRPPTVDHAATWFAKIADAGL